MVFGYFVCVVWCDGVFYWYIMGYFWYYVVDCGWYGWCYRYCIYVVDVWCGICWFCIWWLLFVDFRYYDFFFDGSMLLLYWLCCDLIVLCIGGCVSVSDWLCGVGNFCFIWVGFSCCICEFCGGLFNFCSIIKS